MDQIINKVDPEIKQLFEEQQSQKGMANKFSLLYPSIEVASNLFEDVNLFMMYPDQQYPENAGAVREDMANLISNLYDSGEARNAIMRYFTVGWENYSRNLENFLANKSSLKIDDFLKADDGFCYPAYKRALVAKQVV